MSGAAGAASAGEVSARRVKAALGAMRALECDALVVRDTACIRWLTGFDGVFDTEQAHALLLAPDGSATLHTDSRYANAARAAAEEAGNVVAVDSTAEGHAAFAKRLLGGNAGDCGNVARLGFEDSVSYREYRALQEMFPDTLLVPTTEVVRTLRAVKDADEIARLQEAQDVADAAFQHMLAHMACGMEEREVQRILEGHMLEHGAEEVSFRSIVACGPNGADPHAVPGSAVLQPGQCVVVDFGARVRGYCSDTTRVVFLGPPSAEMQRAYEVLRQANEQVEAALRPGVTGKEAHQMAERILADGGFAGRMGHGLGHGVGLDIHELPNLNTRNDEPLAAGNVVTVEPGIYIPGAFGMRLEDCGVLDDAGYHPFSRLTHDPIVVG